MRQSLLQKIEEIQKSLHEKREIGIAKLEILSDETRQAFDEAIAALRANFNFREELGAKREQLRQWRISWFKTIFPVNFTYILSAPFIYAMIFPIVLLHAFLEVYQRSCFRLYGIPLVRAREYFVFDRHLLPYLNWIEKINCLYCSYGANVFRYATEITARTERFWCPIKYARYINHPHSQYEKFVDIMDAEHFRQHWQDLRKFDDLKLCEEKCDFGGKSNKPKGENPS